MFPIFPFLNRGDRTLLNDSDLKKREKNDKYFRNKRLTDFGALAFCLVIIGIGVVIVTQYISDPIFKQFVIERIKENFSGIIFFVISLAGLSHMVKK